MVPLISSQRIERNIAATLGARVSPPDATMSNVVAGRWRDVTGVCSVGLVQPPSGTVTFLFTDIEGSTRLWEERPDEMQVALAEHDALVRGAIDAYGGYVFSTGGDGFAVAFSRAHDAVDAATKAQAALADHPLIRVRMGVHTGEVQERDGDYFGSAVNRAARIMAVGHGGQVLVSQTSANLIGGVGLHDLGEHRLRDLSGVVRLFQLGGGSFPPVRSLDPSLTNLPSFLSELIGREDDVARAREALATARIVTITGVGGVGKTRLAYQVAAELVPSYPDGVWVSELGALREPELVPEALAATLRVQGGGGEDLVDTIGEVLAASQLLLVFDNCEHVIGEAARVIERLVSRCASVDVLATSREGLAVDGERVVPLRSLGLPEMGTDPTAAAAVRLFLSRSDAVRGGVVFGAGDLEAVATICRRLDGIPLAIELAAARTRSLSPADIASRLDQRFDLLTGGRRTAVERHQTLRATLDWSFDMLSNTEQLLFARMAVFASWFDLDAIVAVCADTDIPTRHVVGLVDELVAKSMLVAETEGSTRFRLLETLRQYGLETLDKRGELDRWRDAHARHLVWFAASLGLDGSGWPRDENIDRAVAALDDVRLARSWLQTRGDEVAVAALVLDLYVLVAIGSLGTDEWTRWCSEALSLDLTATVKGPLLARLAFGQSWSGEIAAAVVDADAALALGPDPVAYTALVLAHMWQQRFDDMDAAFEAGQRAYPDIVGFATAYRRVSAFGIMGPRTSSLEEIRAERDVLIDALRGVDCAPMVSYLHMCAAVSLVMHDPAEALVHAREALRGGGRFPMTAAWGNFIAGHASMFTGRTDDAVRHYTAALDPMLRAGLFYAGIVQVLDALAMVALPDDPAWAWTMVGHRRRVVAQHGDHHDFINPDSRQTLEASLPPESLFTEHIRRGTAMSTAELAAHARTRLESLEATQ